jgi:hypothetical protein
MFTDVVQPVQAVRAKTQINLYAAETDTTGTFYKNILDFNFSYDRVDTLDRVSVCEGLRCSGGLGVPGQSGQGDIKQGTI